MAVSSFVMAVTKLYLQHFDYNSCNLHHQLKMKV